MCEICFDGSCSNPFNHPQELTFYNLTQEGFNRMIDKINKLQRCLSYVEDESELALINEELFDK